MKNLQVVYLLNNLSARDIGILSSVESVIINQTFGSWKSIQFTPCLMSRSQILVRDMLATIRATIRFLSIIDQD